MLQTLQTRRQNEITRCKKLMRHCLLLFVSRHLDLVDLKSPHSKVCNILMRPNKIIYLISANKTSQLVDRISLPIDEKENKSYSPEFFGQKFFKKYCYIQESRLIYVSMHSAQYICSTFLGNQYSGFPKSLLCLFSIQVLLLSLSLVLIIY